MKNYPKVCIIILNWNGKKLLKTCLSSLFKLTDYKNYKVVVVDNGSTDGSVEFVKKNFKKADVLALDKNYGFPKGNNEGIKYALKKYTPKYVLLLNNDTEIVQKNWLIEMVRTAETNKKIGVLGPKLLYPSGRIQHAWTVINPKPPHFFIRNYGRGDKDQAKFTTLREVNFLSAACMLIKTNVIKQIGLLDENYSPFWLEDSDFCLRAKKAKFKIIYNGFVKVLHYEGVSMKLYSKSKKISESNEIFYFQRRNMFYFLFKHFSFFDVLFQVPLILMDSIFSITYLRPRKNGLIKFFLVLKGIKETKSLGDKFKVICYE